MKINKINFGGKTLLKVTEEKNGIRTYCDMDAMLEFNVAYKGQLRAFLQEALNSLGGNIKQTKKDIDKKREILEHNEKILNKYIKK